MKNVILFGDEPTKHSNVTLLPEFLVKYAATPNEIKNFRATDVDLHTHTAMVLCSSGTTGLPKGVKLSHFNVIAAMGLFTEGLLNLTMDPKEIVILGVIPWFHAFGCLTLLGVIAGAVQLVSLPKFEEGLFLSCIENYKVQMIFMVPPLMVFLAKHPLVDHYDLSSLKELICGAAPLGKETEDAVYARIKSIEAIRQGYGMSETTLSVLTQREDIRKPGSVGTINRGAYVKVIDPDTGKSLGPNQPGELCFKGSQIMTGYIGNDVATRETIDNDGWLHTGDIGYYDADEHFFIIDRLKELIKYKAYQVPPAEIESILLTNPAIKDAACIGLPDEASGELPMAFIVKQDGATITEQEIIKYVAGN